MKRQNDNPQASKEDYERLSKMGSQVGHGFERVNPEVLKKRRIIKARHPPSASKSSDAKKKNNPFASVSLVQGGGSSSSSKPSFSFGSFGSSKPATTTATTTTTTTTSSPGFSFGSKPLPSVTPSGSSSDLHKKYEERAVNMESSFRSTLDKHGTQCNWLNIFDQYMDSVVKMKFQYFTELKNNPPPPTTAVVGSTTTAAATTGGAISFAGFGSSTTATTSNATSTPTGTNLFGSFASSSSSTTTNKVPSFSFGTTIATTSLAPTTFGTVDKTSSKTTTSDTTTDAAPGEDQQQQQEQQPLDRSDVDWDDVELIENVLLYHKRNANKPTKFASGLCRIQKKKSDPSVRRMIHRDIAGKVRFNVQIYKGMDFGGSVYKRKNGHRERVIFMGIMDKEHGREMFEIHRVQVPGSSLADTLKKAADF